MFCFMSVKRFFAQFFYQHIVMCFLRITFKQNFREIAFLTQSYIKLTNMLYNGKIVHLKHMKVFFLSGNSL